MAEGEDRIKSIARRWAMKQVDWDPYAGSPYRFLSNELGRMSTDEEEELLEQYLELIVTYIDSWRV